LVEPDCTCREFVEDVRTLVEERRALLHYLDTGSVAPPPARKSPSTRHVPFALHRATPPTGVRVARRALVLAALALRARLELFAAMAERAQPEDGVTYDTEGRRREILQWIKAHDLASECEPLEIALLEQPVGCLPPGYLEWLFWMTEGLPVLA